MGDKPQIHSNLTFELGVFLKGKNKEAGINHRLVTFLNRNFRGQDVSSLKFSSQVVHGLGVC